MVVVLYVGVGMGGTKSERVAAPEVAAVSVVERRHQLQVILVVVVRSRYAHLLYAKGVS